MEANNSTLETTSAGIRCGLPSEHGVLSFGVMEYRVVDVWNGERGGSAKRFSVIPHRSAWTTLFLKENGVQRAEIQDDDGPDASSPPLVNLAVA